MDVDWWARGIGLAALVIALFGLGWRVLEFWATGRASLRVRGSAGVAQQTGAGPYLIRSKRVGYSLVVVDVINNGRRPAVVMETGFIVPGSDRRSRLTPAIRDLLPKKLEPGESVTVTSRAQSFFDAQADPPAQDVHKLRPYCMDAEGKMHMGKVDHHFRQLIALQSVED